MMRLTDQFPRNTSLGPATGGRRKGWTSRVNRQRFQNKIKHTAKPWRADSNAVHNDACSEARKLGQDHTTLYSPCGSHLVQLDQ